MQHKYIHLSTELISRKVYYSPVEWSVLAENSQQNHLMKQVINSVSFLSVD